MLHAIIVTHDNFPLKEYFISLFIFESLILGVMAPTSQDWPGWEREVETWEWIAIGQQNEANSEKTHHYSDNVLSKASTSRIYGVL